MEFYINDEKIDVSLENEKTVGDVFKSFEIICEENQSAVTKIKLNDKNIEIENFDEISKQNLNGNEKFEFNIISKEEIKIGIKNLLKSFEFLNDRIKQIPLDLQCGKIKESFMVIKNLADCISDFCHISTLSALFPEISVKKIDEQNIQDFFADFTPILSDFEEAIKQNDTITISDLCEYEISPRLENISKSLEEICQ